MSCIFVLILEHIVVYFASFFLLEVDSKHGLVKGFSLGIFRGQNAVEEKFISIFRVRYENFRRTLLPPSYPPLRPGAKAACVKRNSMG